jgi:predicted kinase
MCGLAFSGKTTLARAIVGFTGATYVGLDEINRERGLAHGGEGLPVAEWERTHRLALERAHGLMAHGAPVVWDDTSNLRFLRDRVRTLARNSGYDVVLVYVDTPLAEIRRRMAVNARHGGREPIRDAVFEEHVRTFEPPAADEHPAVFTPGQPVDAWLHSALGGPAS